ncbi:MAG: hypothetical protein LBK29_01925 [Oscillospiraceae bacterium]|jgi:hypothetical protein|nr:hypothetical protein [Oscillospiraceae bacterium]
MKEIIDDKELSSIAGGLQTIFKNDLNSNSEFRNTSEINKKIKNEHFASELNEN